MPGVARVGDIHTGICDHGINDGCPHSVTGTIVSGSSKTDEGGAPIARIGDQVVHNCPHCGTGVVVSGSGKFDDTGSPVARLGDAVVYPGGSGTIVSASGKFDSV